MSNCPFHKMLRHLKVFAGLPVPDNVVWVDGKPDFRQMDPVKMLHHIRFKLCSVCGKKLSMMAYWVGGPRCRDNHYFLDSAMHQECAREAMRLCPFLSGDRDHYRGALPVSPLHTNTGKRPEQMFLMRGLTAAIEVREVMGEPAIYAGDRLDVVEEF